MKKRLLTTCLILLTCMLFSQEKRKKTNQDYLKANSTIKEFVFNDDRQSPSLIKINPSSNISSNSLPSYLKDLLQIENESFTFNKLQSNKSKNGFEIVTFAASYNGHILEHGRYKAFVKDNLVTAISMEHYNIDSSLSTSASLTNDQARQKATDHVGAELYVWDQIANEMSRTTNNETLQELQAQYDEYFPAGELVYIDNYTTPEIDLSLAYKFNIYASKPVFRANMYVDANSGDILLVDAIIKHADEINKRLEAANSASFLSVAATGDTRYAGTRSFQTTLDDSDPLNPMYSLDGTIDVVVDGSTVTIDNETRSYDGVGGAPISLPSIPSYSIYDGDSPTGQTTVEIGDNVWSADEHWRNRFDTLAYPVDNETNNDDIALDAHWGAEIVIKYWADIHNRSSYDNLGTKVTNYVHYGDAYDNAFWNGSAMTYGDGSYQGGTNANGSFAPLVSMDVCGHEIGHGVCSFTADLVYASESGAMNEGFSDIWAACVENYVLTNIDSSLPYDPWGIGEQIDETDGGVGPGNAGTAALRWMDDPGAEGDPSCYGGDDWTDPDCEPTLVNDYCGVHSNSGVLNKWFYLLVEGSGNALTPGNNKASADDELRDDGLPYSVQGIGFLEAEQIAFQAEVLLTPNATFEDMRAASVLVAEQIHGAHSTQVIAVENAWYGVNVGNGYIQPDPNQVFFEASSTSLVDEGTDTNGCSEFKTVTVDITAVNVISEQIITFDLSNSTATLGEDFDISDTQFTFPISSETQTQTVTFTIYNDGLAEGLETIVFEFLNGTTTRTHNLSITDDDYIPTIGTENVELLNETFSTSELPEGWEMDDLDGVSLDANRWLFNGSSITTEGLAYVENRTVTGTGPSYDSTVFSSIDLISKPIDAKGITNITVQFDWEAGGEQDSSGYFDYGEFLYSVDGESYFSVEKFAGTVVSNGAVTQSGTFNLAIPELDNEPFVLIWRWYNDSLLGTAFSFTIDNVLVTGTPTLVETDVTNSDSETVKLGNEIYFISDQDAGIIAKIENASADLGCVTMNVVESGNASNFSNLAASHTGKVIQIVADGIDASTANYDITLYYTDDELSDFSNPNALQIIKVSSDVIDDATDIPSTNYTIAGGLFEENTAQQYRAFKGTFTGNSTFALVSQETLSSSSFKISDFRVYPTVVNNMESIHIANSKTNIENVAIYNINGVLIESVEFNNLDTVSIPLTNLASGMYFLKINNNAINTFKFIVK